jgi:D-serine deaminase-like pyridoxal phosphate-dependent protein
MISITEPVLLLDKTKCLTNIQNIYNRAKQYGLIYRPHFKTHQSHVVGNWYRELGVQQITVSSLRMAEYFAADGWTDITVAFPVNILEIERINRLAKAITLNVIVEDETVIRFLQQHLKASVNAFVKIDVGYRRTGISSGNSTKIKLVVEEIAQSNQLRFTGFLAHAGHTYTARDNNEIIEIHNDVIKQLLKLKNLYQPLYPDMKLSIGDTPAGSIANGFEEIDEIRPGNAAFYDMKMVKISACRPAQIAVAMAAPVVSLHPERFEVIVYCGSVHLSKDFYEENGKKEFGKVVLFNDSGWSLPVPEAFISGLSQEHGHLRGPLSFIESLKVGDIIGILPAHSCLAAACMRSYTTLEGQRIEMMNW